MRNEVVASIVAWMQMLERTEPEAYAAVAGFFENPGFKTLEIHANANRIAWASCRLNFNFENGRRNTKAV